MQEGSDPWLECQAAPIGSARPAQPTERSALNPVVAVSRPMVLVLSVFGSVHVPQRLQHPHLCCPPFPHRPRPTPHTTLHPRTQVQACHTLPEVCVRGCAGSLGLGWVGRLGG